MNMRSARTVAPGRDTLQPRRRQVRYPQPQHRHERKQGARQRYTVKKHDDSVHTINATPLTDDWSINQQYNIKYT